MANDTNREKGKMETDIELINGIKEKKDTDCLKTLIDRHSGIYIDMVNRYISETKNGLVKEDLLQDKDYSIYSAAINFNETKNTKFSTYLGNLAKWKCLNLYNKSNKFPQESLEEKKYIFFEDGGEMEKLESIENLQKIQKAIEKSKDERIKTIFRMRYFSEDKLVPWKKIAKKLDLSIQGCINIHNNYLEEIKKYV